MRDIKLYLSDILESLEKIKEYTKGSSLDDFKEDSKIQDAVIRRFEIIGEAVKNIPESVREKHKHIPWKKIAGLRDVLTHAYFGVNTERTWKLIEENIPKLKEDIIKLLEEQK